MTSESLKKAAYLVVWLLIIIVMVIGFYFLFLLRKVGVPLQCTMCTLFHTNSAGMLKLGHILKNPKKYFNEHIFFPALTTRRKMESFKFL